jgi:hypothetical protein
MEEKKKCSSKKHSDIDARYYCIECNVFICIKCFNFHSELCDNHHTYELNKNVKEIFTGLCPEINHGKELDYFCSDHNQLCCVVCLSKVKDNGYGKHSDCKFCKIEEIKDEKKNKLAENIKNLEELSNTINNSIKELKEMIEKINKSKEEIKLKIAKVFAKIRNAINEREDEIISDIDKKYNNLGINEEIIRKSEKLPQKIKISLDNGKTLNDNWDNNEKKLNNKINDCINIENNIKNIIDIKKSVENNKLQEVDISFLDENDEEVNYFIKNIKIFGEAPYDKLLRFKPGNNYIIANNGKIATKNNGGNKFNCVIFGNKEIPKNKTSSWKIKLNSNTSQSWDILIGIGPDNPNNENEFYKKCWSFISSNSQIYLKNDGCTNYNNHSGRLKQGDIVEVIVDRKLGNLSFAVNNINYGIACSNIPKDEILFPTITIFDQNLSVEII